MVGRRAAPHRRGTGRGWHQGDPGRAGTDVRPRVRDEQVIVNNNSAPRLPEPPAPSPPRRRRRSQHERQRGGPTRRVGRNARVEERRFARRDAVELLPERAPPVHGAPSLVALAQPGLEPRRPACRSPPRRRRRETSSRRRAGPRAPGSARAASRGSPCRRGTASRTPNTRCRAVVRAPTPSTIAATTYHVRRPVFVVPALAVIEQEIRGRARPPPPSGNCSKSGGFPRRAAARRRRPRPQVRRAFSQRTPPVQYISTGRPGSAPPRPASRRTPSTPASCGSARVQRPQSGPRRAQTRFARRG